MSGSSKRAKLILAQNYFKSKHLLSRLKWCIIGLRRSLLTLMASADRGENILFFSSITCSICKGGRSYEYLIGTRFNLEKLFTLQVFFSLKTKKMFIALFWETKQYKGMRLPKISSTAP